MSTRTIKLELEFKVIKNIFDFEIIEIQFLQGQYLIDPKSKYVYPLSNENRTFLGITVNNYRDFYLVESVINKNNWNIKEFALLDKDFNKIEVNDILYTDDFDLDEKYIIVEKDGEIFLLDKNLKKLKIDEDNFINFDDGDVILTSINDKSKCIINKDGKYKYLSI